MNMVVCLNVGSRRFASRVEQHGIATLMVVMVLFFLVSMVAAYASRNLIFEQRTSANQYRSTQSLETAEAGLNWALGLLNSGRIDNACAATTDTSLTSFRDRYLSVDPTTGNITPVTGSGGSTLTPACIFDGANWSCHCMTDGAPSLPSPSGSGVFPAFRVRFTTFATRADMVQIDVNGCTRNSDTCLAFPASGAENEGRVTISALIALRGSITTTPAAPLTAKGNVDLGGAAATLVNSLQTDPGITVQAGGTVNSTGLVLVGTPGTPPARTVVASDTALAALSADMMFSNAFGATRGTYRDQPGAVALTCGGGTCNAAQVRTAISLNPGRMIWVAGDLSVDTSGDIGSATAPVALVITGSITFTTPVNIYGLIYSQSANWVTSGSSTVQGAVMAEGNVSGTSPMTVVYNSNVLTRLRVAQGSYAMVPGSWRDFQ